LDEDLQRAFHELVKARGLSLDVARYMMEYMSSKESTEYVRWLHKLKAFFTC
jgi:complement component 1 Q subcomponent-binding protein